MPGGLVADSREGREQVPEFVLPFVQIWLVGLDKRHIQSKWLIASLLQREARL